MTYIKDVHQLMRRLAREEADERARLDRARCYYCGHLVVAEGCWVDDPTPPATPRCQDTACVSGEDATP